MQIRNKLFPYPILNNFKDVSSYNNSEYELCYEMEIDKDKLILKDTYIHLNNVELQQLMNEGKAKAVVIVECSNTIYRENFEVFLEKRDIVVDLYNLKDNVVISSFIYATENITNYKSIDFLEDYEDYNFNIEKYNYLAIDDGTTTKIEYDEKEDRKVASIFSIIKDTDSDLSEMKIDVKEKKIIIRLPETQFNLYDRCKFNDNFINIFFAILAIPALIHSLDKLRGELEREEKDFDELEMDYLWFMSIKKAYKKTYDRELDEDEFRDMDTVKIAQNLLNNGSLNAINDLVTLVLKSGMGDEEDE